MPPNMFVLVALASARDVSIIQKRLNDLHDQGYEFAGMNDKFIVMRLKEDE